MSIEVCIVKKLSNFTLNLEFKAENTRTGILGASGCGKSMTLKCIAGIETPDYGKIVINGKTVFDSEKRINVKPQLRKCGLLFQDYALFPNMSVLQNIEQVLYKLPKKQRREKAFAMMEQFQIVELADQKPTKLSGGQQQRASLARLCVLEPEIIMLDEPFSALDSFLKQQIEDNVMNLLSDFKGTLLFVSHNRDEIFRVCQNIHIISGGKISRSGTCKEVFFNPQTVSSASLSGCKNIAKFIKKGEYEIFVPDWNLSLKTAEKVVDKKTHVGIRAHFIRKAKQGESENCFDFCIKKCVYSPFSICEYIYAEDAKSPIIREMSVDSSTVENVPMEMDVRSQDFTFAKTIVRKFCLPKEDLMLLS